MKQKLLLIGAQLSIGPFFRDVGEGAYGPKLKAAYWWSRGKKTLWGFLIALFGAALAAFAPSFLAAAGSGLALAGAIAINLGLLDKAVHARVVIPDWFTEGFHTLLGYGATLSGVVGIVAHFAPPMWADRLDLVCGAVAEACLLISAFMTDKPYRPPSR
jgi:hypothetical protein